METGHQQMDRELQKRPHESGIFHFTRNVVLIVDLMPLSRAVVISREQRKGSYELVLKDSLILDQMIMGVCTLLPEDMDDIFKRTSSVLHSS